MLYFGDSIRSDVRPAKKFADWDTVMVLEEMESETHENVNADDDQDEEEKNAQKEEKERKY